MARLLECKPSATVGICFSFYCSPARQVNCLVVAVVAHWFGLVDKRPQSAHNTHTRKPISGCDLRTARASHLVCTRNRQTAISIAAGKLRWPVLRLVNLRGPARAPPNAADTRTNRRRRASWQRLASVGRPFACSLPIWRMSGVGRVANVRFGSHTIIHPIGQQPRVLLRLGPQLAPLLLLHVCASRCDLRLASNRQRQQVASSVVLRTNSRLKFQCSN